MAEDAAAHDHLNLCPTTASIVLPQLTKLATYVSILGDELSRDAEAASLLCHTERMLLPSMHRYLSRCPSLWCGVLHGSENFRCEGRHDQCTAPPTS